jgi:hypothetical protein
MREAAREILKEVGPDIARNAAWTVIREHIATCPVKVNMEAKFKVLMVVFVTALVLGVALGNTASTLIMRLIAL